MSVDKIEVIMQDEGGAVEMGVGVSVMSMAESKKESLKRWKVFAKVLLHFGNVIMFFLLLVALPGLLDGLAGGWGIFYALYAGLGIVCDLQFLLIAMLIWNRVEIKENMLEQRSESEAACAGQASRTHVNSVFWNSVV